MIADHNRVKPSSCKKLFFSWREASDYFAGMQIGMQIAITKKIEGS
jgi:hypothetical protein